MTSSGNEDFEARMRASFARQRVMQTLGAAIVRVVPGEVELLMPFAPEFTQQHGFLHAGTLASVLDSACGYAAFTLMPPEAAVLTIEFKANFLAPARGESFLFLGKALKPGRTITFCEAQAFACEGSSKKLISTMTATVMTVTGRAGIEQ